MLESEKYRTFAARNGKKGSMAIDDYRLTNLEEPTEKMLAQVMKEAAEDAREANARATKLFFEEIKQAAASIRWWNGQKDINSARIAKRVMQGGHDVPITKIISRYQKSIVNCKQVSRIVDRVYVYDNSVDDVDARLLFRMSDGILFKQYTDDIPEWARVILQD